MFDAVVGIGGETALEKYIVAVGECLFCAETEFAFPEWGGEQQFGGERAGGLLLCRLVG